MACAVPSVRGGATTVHRGPFKPGPRCELQGPLHFQLPHRSVSKLGLSSATAALVAAMASRGDPSYQKMIEVISKETFESPVATGGAWIGAHGDIRKSPIFLHRHDAEAETIDTRGRQNSEPPR
jgi:hypothetical protein